MSNKNIKPGIYKFLGKYVWRIGFPLGLIFSAGLVVFVFFNPLPPDTGVLHTLLVGILIILGLAWTAVWGWYFVTFRYILYFMAWLLSLIRRFLANGLVRFLILLFILALVQRWRLYLMSYDPERISIFDLSELLKLPFIITTLSLTLIILIFIGLFKARKRLVISEFLNHTGFKELDEPVKGIAPAIVSEILRLVNLYKTIDEIRPKAERDLLKATVSVITIDKDLQDALGGQFEVQVAPGMKINLGSLLKLLSRLVRGPNLCGCLQREGNKLVLTAWITRGRMQGNWRARSADIDSFSLTPAISEMSGMIEEITCRIFTGLNEIGSPRWEVAKSYAEGLRKYRDTERTEVNRMILLNKAKAAFNEALAKDDGFAECYYNLGIIYNKLGNKKSAKTAFRKTLEEKSDDYNSYFELARCFREENDYGNAKWFCEQTINLQPANPNAWNLLAVILYEKWYKKNRGYQNDTFQDGLAVKNEIIQKAEIAVMLSWKALCRAAARGELTKAHKDMAVLCMRNLAAWKGMKCQKWIRWLFWQAFFLSPDDSDLYFELGKYYYRWEKYPQARDAFFKIYEDALAVDDALRFWACYTHTNIEQKKPKYRDIIKDGIIHFLDYAADMLQNEKVDFEDKTFRHRLNVIIINIINSLNIIAPKLKNGEKEKLENEIKFIHDFRIILERQSRIKDIKNLQGYYKSLYIKNLVKLKWAGSQFNILTAKRFLDLEDYSSSIVLLKKAIKKLEKNYPRQIKKLRLHMYLAKAYLNKNECQEALFHAREAVRLNPFNAEERLLLGRVHRALKNYSKALEELECSFRLQPGNTEILTGLGETYKQRGENACESEEKEKAFKAAVNIFSDALKIMRSTSFLEEDNGNQGNREENINKYREDIGTIHFYLGTFHYELLNYNTSTAHFRIAAQMNHEPVLSLIKAGWSYINAGSFLQARQILDEAENLNEKPSKVKTEKEIEALRYFIEIMLGHAAAFVEGAVSLKDKKKNREAHKKAEDRLKQVPKMIKDLGKKLKKKPELEDKYREFIPLAWAMYHESWGLIHFKEGDAPKALADLEQAVDNRANARIYLKLAEIHRQCAAESAKKSDRLSHLSHARNACNLSRKHDLRQKYGKDIERLRQELDALEKKEAEKLRG